MSDLPAPDENSRSRSPSVGPPPFTLPRLPSQLSSPDAEIKMALEGFLLDEPPESIRSTMKELVPLETLRKATPVMAMILKRLLIHRRAMPIHEPGTNVKATMMEVLRGSDSDVGSVFEAPSPREYRNVTMRAKHQRPPYQRQE